jgi:hypothetical protein
MNNNIKKVQLGAILKDQVPDPGRVPSTHPQSTLGFGVTLLGINISI